MVGMLAIVTHFAVRLAPLRAVSRRYTVDGSTLSAPCSASRKAGAHVRLCGG